MGAYCPLDWLAGAGFADPSWIGWLGLSLPRCAAEEPRMSASCMSAWRSRPGPRVIEFNARFGDPDSQVVLARLRTGLGVLLRAAATGRLEEFGALHWSPSAAVNVVLAAQGYPSAPALGDPVGGIDEPGRGGGGDRAPRRDAPARLGRAWSPRAGACSTSWPSVTISWRRGGRHTRGSCAGWACAGRTTAQISPLRNLRLPLWITKTHL